MKLERITASVRLCKEIVAAGIDLPAALWHYKNGVNPEHWYTDKAGNVAYESVPAWTKEELDVMIGNDFAKPDLSQDMFAGRAHDPRKYHVFLPDKMLIVEKGADASAEFLLYLLKMNKLNPVDVVKRFKEIYKL